MIWTKEELEKNLGEALDKAMDAGPRFEGSFEDSADHMKEDLGFDMNHAMLWYIKDGFNLLEAGSFATGLAIGIYLERVKNNGGHTDEG